MSAKWNIFCTILVVTLETVLQCVSALPVPQTEIKNVSCWDTLDSLGAYTPSSVFTVKCPPQCLNMFSHVMGTENYTPSSNLCVAGIHAGVITDNGGVMKITVQNKWINPIGSKRNGVRSQGGFAAHTTFNPTAVSTPATQQKQTTMSQTRSSTSASSTTSSTTITTTATTTYASSTSLPTSVSITPSSSLRSTTTQQALSITSKQPGNTGDTVIENRADSTTEISTFRNKVKATTKSPPTPATTSLRTVKIQPPGSVFTSTAKNDKDKTIGVANLENQTGEKSYLQVWIPCAIGGLSLLIFILLVWLLCRRCRLRRPRATSRGKRKHCSGSGGIETCVCYVAVDSSVQALLNDPETCDRPCELRDRLQDFDDPSESSCHAGPQCDDCSGEKCASQYDF